MNVLETPPGIDLDALYKTMGVKPHPAYPLPDPRRVLALMTQPQGREEFAEFCAEYKKIAELTEKDPFHYVYEPPSWLRADALVKELRDVAVFGPNRIGKTEWAANRVCRILEGKEYARAWCLCESHKTSVRGGGQQEVVYKHLPVEWKADSKHGGGISYNEKNRFSGDMFVSPNHSECQFMNYEQDIKVIEGGAVDVVWCDELVPVEWVKTLRGRLVDRDGCLIITFTPIYGWNETVADYVQGGDVVETRDFPLFPDMKLWPGLPPGKIPYVVRSIDHKRASIFFQLKENPYVPWQKLVDRWKTSSVKEQLVRLAGITQKTTGNRFPRFGKAHIVPWEKIPGNEGGAHGVTRPTGTNYHVIDFAWARPWAQLWARVIRIKDKRRIFIYRDWPDKKTYGEWVLRSSKPNGSPGPAQNSLGLDVSGYKRLILQLESKEAQKGYAAFRNAEAPHPGLLPKGEKEKEATAEAVFQRLGDPRSGAAEAVTAEDGGSSFFDMMGMDHDGAPGMDVNPVKLLGAKRFIGEGIQKINDWLNYDDEKPVSTTNEPELFIWEGCEQLIDCLQIWTGAGSENQQASKDFIDLLRYLAVEDIDDYPPGTLGSSGGGSY